MRKGIANTTGVCWADLMLVSVILWILIRGSGSVSAQTIVGGRASGVWTLEGSPYLFAGYVVVQDESLLH